MTSEEITRSLTAVLLPAPGNTVAIPAIHRAVLRHTGYSDGAPYRAIKDVLRAVGVVVSARRFGAEYYAHGVSLAPGYDVALERRLRDLRQSDTEPRNPRAH